MTDRFTKRDAYVAFERLCNLLGKTETIAGDFKAGSWSLDYAPCYGGSIVHEILTDGSGGVRELFGPRKSPREFWQMVRDIEVALGQVEVLRSVR